MPVTAGWIGRAGLLALGVVATWLALDATGLLRGLETGGPDVLRNGWLGAFAIPLALGAACVVTSASSLVRAGLALGCVAPSALIFYGVRHSQPLGFAVWCVVAATCAAVAWCAVRRSGEPAAVRVTLTCAGVGALLLGSCATMLWWPAGYSTYMHEPVRVLPTPHVGIAAVLLAVTLVDLRARRTRALLTLSAAGISIALAPHFGYVLLGCWDALGPLDHLVLPKIIAPAVLMMWAGPVVAFLRGR